MKDNSNLTGWNWNDEHEFRLPEVDSSQTNESQAKLAGVTP